MIDTTKIRGDFEILKRKIHGCNLVYFDSGATSQKPESVIIKMDDYFRNNNANIHRGVYDLSVESTQMVDEARASVAAFINSDFEEIIFTRNTSESINLVTYAWGDTEVNKGDSVIVTRLEHHSNLIPWQELCRRKGAVLKVVEIDCFGNLILEKGRLEIKTEDKNGLKVMVGALEDLLDETVKMVAFTGQSNVLGTITPIEEIVKRSRKKSSKVIFLVDAAQQIPHSKVDVKKMGVDFVAFSGHKMLGPGVGVLWGRKELLKSMKPFLYGGDMIGEVSLTGATWADLPAKFEAGTPDIAGIIGLGEAVNYLKNIGMEKVRDHEKELTVYALEKMTELEEKGLVEIYGPRNADERGAAITFNVKGVHAHDTAQILNNYGIAVRSGQHCAAPLVTSFGVSAMVRATFYIYNTKEEIDYLIEKIIEVPKVFS